MKSQSAALNFVRRAACFVGVLALCSILPLLGRPGFAQAQTVNICDRTAKVEARILAAITTVTGTTPDCASVSASDLAGLSGSFSLHGSTPPRLTSLQAGDLAGLSGLTELVLSHNDLTTLPAGVFADLSSLEILYLTGNDLTTLTADMFVGLSSLTTLFLHKNQLTTLPARVFAGLGNLTKLELSGDTNELTRLPAEVFVGLSKLTFLDMDDQPVFSPYILHPLTSLITIWTTAPSVVPYSPGGTYTRPDAPGDPTALRATFTDADGSMTLNWTAPTDGGTPTSYQILRKAGSEDREVYVEDTFYDARAAVTYTDTSVSRGVTYEYQVVALNAGGASGTTTTTITASPPPAVTIAPRSGATTVTEGTAVAFTLTRTGATANALTVNVQVTQTGTVIKTADSYQAPTTVAFTAGARTATLTVETQADEVDAITEVKGTITAEVTAGTGYTLGTTVSATVTVTDDDDPQVAVSFVPGSYTATEGGPAATVTVMLDIDPKRTVTIPLVATPQDGATTADYSLLPSVTFNTGETMQEITVTATDDAIDDDGESMQLGFGSSLPDRVTAGSPATVTVTLADDDDPQVAVSFVPGSYTATEGGPAATVTVMLDIDPKRTVTIPLVATPQDGATTADYSLLPSVTFNTGETTQEITVTATDDAIDDDDESMQLGFGSSLPDRVTAGSPATVTVAIDDNDDPQVRVSFAQPRYTATEGGTEATVTVTLDPHPERTVTIPLTAMNRGGATDADYTGVPPSVTFTSGGPTAQTFTVTAIDDALDDDGESVQLGFGSPLPDRVTTGSAASVTLADNDVRGVEVSEPTLDIPEGDSRTYTLVLTSEPTADVTVTVTGAAGDVRVSGSPLTFTSATWAQPQTVTVAADDDTDAIADTPVTLRHAVTGGDYGAVAVDTVRVTIIEQGAHTLTIESEQAPESAREMVFAVALNKASSEAVTVDYATANGTATAGEDYTATSGPLTFPADSTTPQEIRVPLLDDEIDEAEEETFTVRLSNAMHAVLAGGGTTLDATGTITDDDVPVVRVSFGAATYTVDEGKAVDVTLRLSADPERRVAISLTPTLGDNVESSDYTGVPATVVFESGDREQTFSFVALADQEAEAAETVTLNVGVPAGVELGSPATTVVTIAAPSRRPPVSPPGPRGGGGGGGAPACTQDDVHGNSAARATDIVLSSPTPGAICPAVDVDYFTLTAPGRGLLFVDTTGRVDTRGTIWQDGAALAAGPTREGRQAARLGARVQAGPVVVALHGQGGATGPYAVVVTFVPGYLENPGPNSFQSGVRVLSGWVCEADTVELELGHLGRQEAAYGTERLDTREGCGDTDNGFGLLFNWNRLGDGAHEVVAFVDGVELGRATVTVTTLGQEFLRGAEGECVVEGFPMPGETVTLEWQQTQQNFVLAAGPAPEGRNRTGSADVGYLENPGPHSFQSGIGIISGWVCEGDEVLITLNGEPQPAAYGTERLDTLEVCGDTDNGFGLLFNWNRLGDGEHDVVAYVDDEELGRATVTVTTLGHEFLRGAEGECLVDDFPLPGETVTLEWQQNSQNFVVTAVE